MRTLTIQGSSRGNLVFQLLGSPIIVLFFVEAILRFSAAGTAVVKIALKGLLAAPKAATAKRSCTNTTIMYVCHAGAVKNSGLGSSHCLTSMLRL
jgi:hypothetical protein